jgi:hypothetical protein
MVAILRPSVIQVKLSAVIEGNALLNKLRLVMADTHDCDS